MRWSSRSSTVLKTIPAASAITATAAIMLIFPLAGTNGMAGLIVQPSIKQPQGGGPVDHAARNPHHQPGKLLVGGWVEADAGPPQGGIGGVPGALRQRHERPHRALDGRRQEQAGGGKEITAALWIEHRHPEQ